MTPRPAGSKLAGMGLAARLLINSLLVVVAGAGTVLVTGLLVAPAVFQTHLQVVQPAPDPQTLLHIARAFDESILIALGVGVLIAGVTAAGRACTTSSGTIPRVVVDCAQSAVPAIKSPNLPIINRYLHSPCCTNAAQ